jgi:predicted double-glycine peptidase
MVLDYLHIPVAYPRLQRLLNVRYFGAFFSDIERLSSLGVAVTVAEGDFDELQNYLESGLPVIVAVNTGFLPSYWSEAVGHAVVIIGVDSDVVFVNDPALATAPQSIDFNELMAAWAEKDCLYAVIRLE